MIDSNRQGELSMLGYWPEGRYTYVCNLPNLESKISICADGFVFVSHRSDTCITAKKFKNYELLIDHIITFQDSIEASYWFKKISSSIKNNLKIYVYAKRDKKTSRQVTDNMLRVKSSNVWAYAYDIEMGYDTGTLYIQFKDKDGRAGDIYQYFEVPLPVWKKFVGTGSKGHYFWKKIRNKYRYRKLTGDKRGKLPNAIN